MSSLDLLVIGDANPDLIMSGEDVHPVFGQMERVVDSGTLVLGGSGSITAVGAAKLGLSVGLCAVLGNDDLGLIVANWLAAENIDITHLHQHPTAPTGITVVLAEPHDRAILTALGTITMLSSTHLELLADFPAKHVHVSSYYLMSEEYRSCLPHHLKRFRESGATTSLDTNWDPSGEWDLGDVLMEVDIFLPNRAELEAITGLSSTRDAIAQLANSCPGEVAVKDGENGATTIANDQLLVAPAIPISHPVDAVGAGDSFNAGYLWAALKGKSALERIQAGVASGSLSVRGAGGTATQGIIAEIETLLNESQ